MTDEDDVGKQPVLDLAAFRTEGYLSEMNRRFLHPLGLAMFIHFDDDDVATSLGIFDSRDDPEGVRYWVGPGSTWPEEEQLEAARTLAAHAAFIDGEWEARRGPREERLGYMVQPLDRVLTDAPREDVPSD